MSTAEPASGEAPSYVVRRGTERDLPGLLDVLEDVAREGRWIASEAPIDRDFQRKRIEDRFLGEGPGALFVAETSRVVGFADIGERAPGLFYLGMAIVTEHRRRGIGARLLESCLDHARAQDAHKVALEVWPDNAGAIALYERFGFEREGYLSKHYRRKNGAVWDSIVMGLRMQSDVGS